MDPAQLNLFPELLPRYPLVVGITSPAPRSGKTTVADVLVNEYGYTRVKFAKYLKQMVTSILEALGYGINEALNLIENRKDIILPELGCTLRHIMETLGTDWGRYMVNENLWVKLWSSEVSVLLSMNKRVVVDDMRFPNELEAVQSISGSETLCVIRTLAQVPPRNGKQVEGLISPDLCTRQVMNDSSIPTIQWWVRNWMEGR